MDQEEAREDVTDTAAGLCERAMDEREARDADRETALDAREALTHARDSADSDHHAEARTVIAGADERDTHADARDSAALDRQASMSDRTSSADDRARLPSDGTADAGTCTTDPLGQSASSPGRSGRGTQTLSQRLNPTGEEMWESVR